MVSGVTIVCVIVHVLINTEKRVAFHKIERSVATHLDVEREIKKQVT